MPLLTVIDRSGQSTDIPADPGQTLMEAIRDAGFDELLAQCGGCMSCATCHVYIEPGTAVLPPQGEDEDDLLSSSGHRQPNSRLSCQVPLDEAMAGLRVTIAPAD